MASPPERTHARPGAAIVDTVGERSLRERAREVLAVPGPSWVRVSGRAVGALTALSVVGALPWGAVGVSLLALVLLGVTLARVLRLPGGLQLLMGLTLLAAAWAALLQLYQRWWWLDVVVHVAATGLLTVLAVVLLARTGLVPAAEPGRPERVMVAAVALAVGLVLSLLWEFGEWLGHIYIDPEIFVSLTDTIGDLAAGGLGTAVAAWWLATTGVP